MSGAPAEKASRLVRPGEPLLLQGPAPRFVSRGGDKLEAALDRFAIDVSGTLALDAGASTGGFTDCLLQRGAASVVAVDAGHDQLHERLQGHPRVRRLDRTNIRHLSLAGAGGVPFDMIVADLSFISLRTVAPVLAEELPGRGADLVVLVKPQFEAGRAVASAGRGVVRDQGVWANALESVASAFSAHGAAMMDLMVSPLTGADGNVEFLAHLQAQCSAGTFPDITAVVSEAARLHSAGG